MVYLARLSVHRALSSVHGPLRSMYVSDKHLPLNGVVNQLLTSLCVDLSMQLLTWLLDGTLLSSTRDSGILKKKEEKKSEETADTLCLFIIGEMIESNDRARWNVSPQQNSLTSIDRLAKVRYIHV
jgi:hypothetical protein